VHRVLQRRRRHQFHFVGSMQEDEEKGICFLFFFAGTRWGPARVKRNVVSAHKEVIGGSVCIVRGCAPGGEVGDFLTWGGSASSFVNYHKTSVLPSFRSIEYFERTTHRHTHTQTHSKHLFETGVTDNQDCRDQHLCLATNMNK
jgi:hypothetical protein